MPELQRNPGQLPIQVLVVDDSAVVRQALTAILGQERDMRVVTAQDPIFALQKMQTLRPDVIVLDLEMPRMDGITFLRRLMKDDPLPVVICSSLAARGAEAAMLALEEGALSVITKPQLGVRDFLHESAMQIIDTVRAAAHSRLRRRRAGPQHRPPVETGAPVLGTTTDQVVVVGASTGGTEALRELLSTMPVDCAGIVVVQHMPELFTAAFAKRLNEVCRIEVKEAEDGDGILVGRALIAPGNRHTEVARSGGRYVVRVSDGPLVSRHRPSVDVLFHSAARAAGSNGVGVIMTGMGDDGANGMLEMKRAGAYNLAQDEASCVVYGMPKEAVERGGVDAVVPLQALPKAILDAVRRGRRG
ncbi:MAG TPA: chemotaxis response regulator protein-glutamate methylesterase [Geothrix sp.]|uniref:protein-glutamate methylesterase/protein-glutamine glutaminase n=1 Tax=Geothrix mesophila TaxID=2922723 RepID=UPI001FAC95DA|nr:chemotaxis response regulator protein-glutamate methylesterase [Geothrix sp. SG198]HJV37756.1 chemotaxis response regulator protein-glutamate methylesterase [Geothrix sp.]